MNIKRLGADDDDNDGETFDALLLSSWLLMFLVMLPSFLSSGISFFLDVPKDFSFMMSASHLLRFFDSKAVAKVVDSLPRKRLPKLLLSSSCWLS